jgi:putative peptidoglycan lipid II flippase
LMDVFSGIGVSDQYPKGYAHVGVALATSCVALVNFLALAWFMRQKIKRLNGREIFSSFIRIAIASAAMSVVAYFSFQFLSGYFINKNFWVRVAEAFIPIILAAVTFVIAAKLLRISELEKVWGGLRRKVAK